VLQSYIPFLPEGAKPINNHVAIYRHDEKIEFFTASGPIYSCKESDPYGLRLAQGIIVTHTATTPVEIAKALVTFKSVRMVWNLIKSRSLSKVEFDK
jgi:hypothetical protein